MLVSQVSNWLRTSSSGKSDLGAYSTKAATPVDGEYARIQDGVAQVGKDIDNVDQDIQLKKVSLKSFKDSELIVGSSALGAIAGAGLGLANSELTSLLAHPSVVVTPTDHDIFKPEFKGMNTVETRPGHDVPTYDSHDGHQNGTTTVHDQIHTHYDAQIEQKNVGHYTTNTHTVINQASGSPLADGLIGMGVGLGVGAGLGTLVAVGRRALGQGYDGHDRSPVKNEAKKLMQTALVGGTAGAGFGLLNGFLESHNAIDMSYKNESPIISNSQIGQIPMDWDRSLLSTNGNHVPVMQPVMADVPKTNFLGHADVNSTPVNVHVDPHFSVAGGIIGGTVVGTAAGLFAGIAINVVRRAI